MAVTQPSSGTGGVMMSAVPPFAPRAAVVHAEFSVVRVRGYDEDVEHGVVEGRRLRVEG